MPKVIMGIGIPGSGKTKVLKKMADEYGYFYICPDDIRLEMTGNADNQTKNKEVWDEAYRRMEQKLKDGKTIVFDATFTDRRSRAICLNFARKFGASKVQGIYLDTPLEIAKKRNAERKRVLPEYVLERMQGNLDYEPLELKEGFDSIFTLDEYHRLMGAELKNGENKIERKFNMKAK